MKGIFAGLLIAIGYAVNFTIGGPIGAILFSTGLLAILACKFNLVTGKMGLLPKGEIKW